MIKFKGGNLIGFGLSEDNVKNLKQGKLIYINMEEMGFNDIQVMIFYGKTEQDMQNDLSEFISEKTNYSSTIDN